MFKNNQIIITSNINKLNLIRSLSNKLLNIKIYSLNEFNNLYYFTYNKETIYYLISKYNIRYEVAKIYLDNMLYLEDKKYQSNKLNNLLKLKKELINNNLLTINNLFKETLINKEIIFYNLSLTKEIEILKNQLSKNNKVSIIEEETNTYINPVYEFSTDIEEVEYICNYICNLVKKGIPLNKIYLCNINSEYRKLLKRIMPMFNIPFVLNNEESIYETFIITKFFELYESDLSNTINKLSEYVDSEETEYIYNKLIDIINDYTFIEDKLLVKEMLKYDLKNTKINNTDIINAIHEVDINNNFNDDNYVILLGFNQGIIPVTYKDEDYLSDKEKEELNLSLTIDKNNQEKDLITKKIQSIKNLLITYKLLSNGESYTKSSIIEDLNLEVINKINPEYLNSNLYNKIKLTSMLDEYYKYGTKSTELFTLYNNYHNLEYNTYDNKFTGINKNNLYTYLNNKLTLSYSSLDNYFKCPFSYYLSNILKLNIYEENFFQLVGTLFHSILEKWNNIEDYDSLWKQEIINLNHEFNSKELFFLDKLKEELKFVIDTIKEQENYTNLHDELHEERIYTSLSGNMKITFTGIIDKIKYHEDDNETIVAIIDYKTGNPNLDLSTLPYGIGMQLPIYLYLIKNTNKLKNIKVAGFYLQKILNNEINIDNKHSYLELKKKNLLLQGYSNSNQDILKEFDSSYQDSNMIASMKVKKDGNFYNYSKVLTTEEMNKITDITENNIKKAATNIEKANFQISPKEINGKNVSCTFCKYKDICYYTNNDLITLEPLSTEEIFK